MSELFAISQKTWPEEVFVEPSRLETGIWGNPEGDIQAAYCADTFPKIRTFTHDGQLFTNCGGCAEESMGCYPLIPESDYNGPEPRQYTYESKASIYHGQKFRLGPKVKFTVRARSLDEWTNLLCRRYAHGGYFAAGKTYRDVLVQFLERERTPEAERTAIEAELARTDLPETQTEMLERLRIAARDRHTRGKPTELQLTLTGV